ncbi:uncharacterized protein STEHIDRAFT_153319 [Stereum hirsutum FP-91666 SS1]|uniref:uncharacterized protein n=1 Tax=Stereum hirsutum (strain FP-91666) TaxID=721885 RepID=UPI000440B992|nr:uncharacterized protein STEHIDRAFT_153319 [Stereum hirsutum FP-91666 SS1]EIM89457.1 hypothetical protein STEHIDRAFT_153319 [Stereum hirsutum FP-91666 SS1]
MGSRWDSIFSLLHVYLYDSGLHLYDTSPATPPLDSLLSLTLAYPNPADLIFDHLPLSLHHLSLTDCPRHYLLLDTSNPLHEYSYDSPILTSSELGGIVRRYNTPDLESLEVVYRADAAEVETLGMIARRSSGLKTLKMFRYVDSADDPVDDSLFASALSPLQHLRHLYIHLNPPETPQFRPGQSGDRRRIALAAFRKALQDTANMFAGAFASSCLEVIFLLERFYGETRWSRWREIRSGDENGKEDGKEHAYCERVDGFEIQEQAAPLSIWNTGFLLLVSYVS